MKQLRQNVDVHEPIGIVIAGGARPEVVPRFSAYIWGPAPTAEAESDDAKAAAA